MNSGQGFAANLTTAALVTTASFHGLPVSTTHVSVGSLLGMGLATRQVKWKPVLGVLASWVVTLPCAAVLAGVADRLIGSVPVCRRFFDPRQRISFESSVRTRLILMLKYPRPGAVKTRLVPVLGETRACELYRALVRHTLATVDEFSRADTASVTVEICLAGAPDAAAARAWLGDVVSIREQGDGDLGARMERATREAFAEGADAAVVIGADCPQLTTNHLAAAWAALRETEIVLGPAADGGYYLIGLRRARPQLFHGIAWSTDAVLAQTLGAARAVSVDCHLLDMLRDVDEPDDLVAWAETASAQSAGRGGVSVVIPALNEAHNLPQTIAAARRGGPHEIIVVDGGSTDGTREIARAHDVIVLLALPGRATQMNRGAAIATGEWLVFLHADTVLPADYAMHVRQTLAPPNTSQARLNLRSRTILGGAAGSSARRTCARDAGSRPTATRHFFCGRKHFARPADSPSCRS